MSTAVALHLTTLHTDKSQELLTHAREVLRQFAHSLTRSESNLGKSYAILARPKPAAAGRTFARQQRDRR